MENWGETKKVSLPIIEEHAAAAVGRVQRSTGLGKPFHEVLTRAERLTVWYVVLRPFFFQSDLVVNRSHVRQTVRRAVGNYVYCDVLIMKRLFNKNKAFEPTPFTTEAPAQQSVPTQRPGRSESLSASLQDERSGAGYGRGHGSQGNFPTQQTQGYQATNGPQSGRSYVSSHQPVGHQSSRQSPDPHYALGVKTSHAQQQPYQSNQVQGQNPGLSASASAKKWFAGLNGKGSGYDQITPFTMPDQPPHQQKSSTSIDRHSWHELAGQKQPSKQGSNYSGVDGSLGQPPTGRHHGPHDAHEGLIPSPAEQGALNVKRRVSLRDHANNRMFGWTTRDKHKDKDKKTDDGALSSGSVQPGSLTGPKVISGMRYEDTAYPPSGQPVPIAKDGSTVYAGRGYGQMPNVNSVSMSRATTQSADFAAERRGSSGSMGESPSRGFVPHWLTACFSHDQVNVSSNSNILRMVSLVRLAAIYHVRCPCLNSILAHLSNPRDYTPLHQARICPSMISFNVQSAWSSSIRNSGVRRARSMSFWQAGKRPL